MGFGLRRDDALEQSQAFYGFVKFDAEYADCMVSVIATSNLDFICYLVIEI